MPLECKFQRRHFTLIPLDDNNDNEPRWLCRQWGFAVSPVMITLLFFLNQEEYPRILS